MSSDQKRRKLSENGDSCTREADGPRLIFTMKSPDLDVTICIDGKELHAPRAFLRLASPVFKTMFDSEFKEGRDSKVTLPDKDYNDFLMFLKCLHPGIQSQVNEQNIYTIVPLAHEYQVPGLLEKCEIVFMDILHKLNRIEQSGYIWGAKLQNALNVTSYADKYDFRNTASKGIGVLRKADPDELAKNGLFNSLSINTKYQIAIAGFRNYFHKWK